MFTIDDENNIYLTRGDSAGFDLTITDEEGEPYTPRPTDVIVLTIKQNYNNVGDMLRKTFDNLHADISSEESLKFNFGTYFYDVRLIDEDLIDTIICNGKFIIGGGTNE